MPQCSELTEPDYFTYQSTSARILPIRFTKGRPMSQPQKDRPWLIRTYAGHSTAEASNALYRANLLKGQTGLSV
ncbi:MAG TPA: hypothetical protein DF966_18405, partial [Sulfitobacter sp.]|nr:hypothetical protein [Sulfitobacter sp.]